MDINLLNPNELTAEQVAAWRRMLSGASTLDSPFFHPAFTRAVASVRDDVQVAVITEAGRSVGFFPFQRDRSKVGRPAGLRLSDLHGVVSGGPLPCNAIQLMHGCRLRAWHFDHLPADQTAFEPFQWCRADSPYIDLREGFDRYCSVRRRDGSSLIAQVRRKSRKIQREVGPLRFEMHTDDDRVFQTILAWKSEQRRRTGTFDVLQFPWVVRLLRSLRDTCGDGFAGVASALYAGDNLIAAHLGLRTDRVLHVWFPTFDHSFSKYSPGLILMLELARTAAAGGIARIDLGKGEAQYKTGLRSDAFRVAEGSVDLRAVQRALRRTCLRLREWNRTSPVGTVTRVPKRILRSAYFRTVMR